MTRTLLFGIALLSIPLVAPAQRNLEVGISGGLTHFYGDLGNLDGPVQWNSTRPGFAITFRDFLNNKKRYVTRALTMETRLSWHRIGYDERQMIAGKDVSELRNYKRGLSFRNDLVGLSTHLVLNAYREPYQPLFQQRFFAYFYVGIGVFYGRPKADLFRGDPALGNMYYSWEDGTLRDLPRGEEGAQVVELDGDYETDLYSYMTQAAPGGGESTTLTNYSPWHIGIPLGAGIRYMVTKKISLGMEFAYYSFFTDQLDNVSERYATYDEIAQAYPDDLDAQYLARYVSDPTGWGTDGTTGRRTSRRGNPGLLDAYSYLSFEVSYKFKRRPGRRSYVSL